jgi:predicted RNA binding protein YcfA (HicA-like mRNA interferase family)
MQKYRKLPTITGQQLVKLLKKDGWEECRKSTAYKKNCSEPDNTLIPRK